VSSGTTITFDDLAQLKVSASLQTIGTLDMERDFLRIYAHDTTGGTEEKTALGTFLLSTPSVTHTSRREQERTLTKGSAEGYSLLLVASQETTEAPYFVAAGTGAVAHAKAILEARGLRVSAEASSSALSAPAVFDAGTSWLAVANDLLARAGFDTAEIDGYGGVLFSRYYDPASLAPTITLEDGPECIFADEVAHEFDLFEVPNKVVALSSGQDVTLIATATNTDPQNRYSIPSRGRTITHVETVSQIESQAALEALARRVLQDKTSAVESIRVRHPWFGPIIGKAARLVYERAELDFVGVAVSQTVTLDEAMSAETRFRRFVRM
jgi:hypothetical protein